MGITATQLEKVAKNKFIPFLENHGFTHVKPFRFYKKLKSGFYQCISAQILRSGAIRLFVHVWVPEFEGEGYDLSKFPKNIGITASMPTYEYDDWYDTFDIIEGTQFGVLSVSKLEEAFAEIMDKFGSNIGDWFDKVKDARSLVKGIDPCIDDSFRQKITRKVLENYD